MQYGYFDEQNKEYVITRPDTPSAWANYLGSPEYGAIISNNAGGYSFVKSGANGRIIRYRFNSPQTDTPGRYIYLRDRDSGDYWSASWQPVAKPLDKYESECRHGTAYTVISSKYDNISTETTYYVPLDKTYEVWRIKITNDDNKPRKLSSFGYIEFTNESNYEQDQVNLQYTLFITRTYFKGNYILQAINENVDKNENGTNYRERAFAMLGEPVAAYCGDRSAFVGRYRDYRNPVSIEQGFLDNTLNYNTNSCGALQADLDIAPGETKTLVFLLGRKNDAEIKEIIDNYADLSVVDKEIEELKNYWHGQLENLKVHTPDDKFNNMVNVWNAYQCYITFIWSRAASFQYCGLRNGFGYRDTVQDIQGIIHLNPELAKKQLSFMISAQVDNGGGLPLVKYTHNAGHEDTPDDESYVRETQHPSYRADDALWLFPTVDKYMSESGNYDYLKEVIPFANNGEGTVYEHLKRAIQFSMERLGANGMPAGLYADWNDCLRMGAKGESTFVAFQLYFAIKTLRKYAELMNDSEYIAYLDKTGENLYNIMQDKCWNEDRYIRGIRDNGVIVGKRDDVEASMWLNPQSWAVISGCTTEEKAKAAMDSAYRELNTQHGAMIMTPAYKDHAFDGSNMVLFNPSTKENGGIFSQSQGWLILAETILGRGDRAYEYWKESSPSTMNEDADTRVIEPYVHGQFVESKYSPFEGRAHVHWLTGTASTVMVASVEGILGLKPEVDGIVIEPCIPSSWEGITIEKMFRGKKLNVTVDNTQGNQKGIKELYVNGEKLEGKLIPEAKLNDVNEIKIVM